MEFTDPRKAYRQSAIQSESMADIFMQLYDQLSSVLYSAAVATEAGDIERKTADVSRALTILVHLQGALDFERGGDVALNLNYFYQLVRREVSEGSVKLDAATLRAAAAHVAEIRVVWEHAQALSLGQAPASSAASSPLAGSNRSSHANASSQDEITEFRAWNA